MSTATQHQSMKTIYTMDALRQFWIIPILESTAEHQFSEEEALIIIFIFLSEYNCCVTSPLTGLDVEQKRVI